MAFKSRNSATTAKALLAGGKRSQPHGSAGRRPLVVAHRGGSLEAPENTLEALAQSVANGSDWQEVDVTLTADEQPVILHDDTLLRTTGAAGEVGGWLEKDVLALPAGNPAWEPEAKAALLAHGVQVIPDFGQRFAHARVPSLAAVLALPKARLMLELKATPSPATLAEKVLGAITVAQAEPRVAIASFDVDILREVHARAPAMPRIGLAEDMAQVAAMLKEQVNVLGVSLGLVRQTARALPPTVGLWAWTVYTEAMAKQAVADGAHAVIADNPTSILRAFEGPHAPAANV